MFGSGQQNVPDWKASQDYYDSMPSVGTSPSAFGTWSSPVPDNVQSPDSGSWLGSLGQYGGVAQGLGGLLSTGADLYGQYKNYQQQGQNAQSYGSYNADNRYYADKLKALINDPMTIKQNPAYAAGLKFSEDAIARKAAALGYTNSGNLLSQLSQNAQDYGTKFYDQEANRLAALSKPNIDMMALQNAANYAKTGILTNGIQSGLSNMGYQKPSTLDKVGATVNTVGKVADIVSKISKFF